MKDKIICIKSGIDIEDIRFKEYYKKLKDQSITTIFLDNAVENHSIVLSNPLVFNEEDYDEYTIDDISFLWDGENIIGHQVITMTKKNNSIALSHNRGYNLDTKYLEKPGCKKTVSTIEYYCEDRKIQSSFLQYYKDRTQGKLESEIKISYEKQITIKKPQS